MENKNELTEMENLFLALADKTRLRLLNLLRNNEVYVNLFSEALRLSQPKVSRHLAYLRNAGMVSTRRDGKWIYYRINSAVNSGGYRLLIETLDWLASQKSSQIDYEKLILLSNRQGQAEAALQQIAPEDYNPVSWQREEIETFLL